MNDNKRQIIISEIKHWKKHRLLPEQYCNFLLALYTEGENHQIDRSFPLKKLAYSSLLFILGSFFPITMLVIYFTEMSFVLQIGLLTFLLLLSVISSIFLFKKGLKGFHIPLITACLIALFESIHFAVSIWGPETFTLALLQIFVCFIWYIVGYKLRIAYLKWVGGLGILFIVIYLLV